MLNDGIESFVGKVFDGSGSSLGITTGVSKGQRDAIMTRDMWKQKCTMQGTEVHMTVKIIMFFQTVR